MKNSSNNSPIFDHNEPWASNEHKVWLASTVKLSRNFSKFEFPAKLPSDKQKQIIQSISQNLDTVESLKGCSLIQAEDMTPAQKEFLYEHFLTLDSFQHAMSGEGFLISPSGSFLATINIRDHIHFQILDCSQELEKAWSELVTIETELGKFFDYAFSSKFGFLTAVPHHCGTGLSIRIFLQMPAILHTVSREDFLRSHQDENVNYLGLQGDPNELIGDVLVVENNYSLGVSEEDIIRQLHNKATKLIVEEKGVRNKLRAEPDPVVRDKVCRAFGLLTHSYRLETQEALDALSLLKLGLSLEWVTGVSFSEINQLFFNCRRAHLLQTNSKEIPQGKIPEYRAEYIRESLQKATLGSHIQNT
ncbi:Protein-arginine kinase [Chlamydiales bacterium SCGC AG-110-M15]|nr:Protein-arginine kinase [Chlamydiales bacterium SCGC AG-110-M15]